MSKKIKLTKGKYAIVDDDDYEYLMQWKWHATKLRNYWYAIRRETAKRPDGSKYQAMIYMHRVVNKTPKGVDTDHKYGNGLNNRKYNLRDSTKSQNQFNRMGLKNKSSKYKGISWCKRDKLWYARAKINGQKSHIGCFKCEKTAAAAYDKFVKKHHGEFARPNIIEEKG